MGYDQDPALHFPQDILQYLEPHWAGTLTLMTLLLCPPRGRVPGTGFSPASGIT